MTPYPASFSVGVRTYSDGAADDFGDPVDAWSDPVATQVYGWAPAGTSEPFNAGREAVTWDLDLLAPPEFACDRKDLVVVPGEGEFKVEGRPQDFTHGPFGFTPGKVVRLKRVEG